MAPNPSPLTRGVAALTTFLVRYRIWGFLLGLALTAVAVPLSRTLTYNRSMDGFFPATDPRLQLYRQAKQWFGSEATLLVVYTDAGLWSPQGFQRQHDLAEALRGLPDAVASVNCLADSPHPQQPWRTLAAVLADKPDQADALRQLVRQTPLYQGVFIAEDGQTTALVVQLKHLTTAEAQTTGLESVRTRAGEQLAPAVAAGAVTPPVVAGTLLMIHDVYEYTEGDGRLLEAAAVLLMGLVIAVCFRSVRWVLLPLVIVYAALYWSRGLWALTGSQLTMVGSVISSLVTVIGVSTVCHFGMHFRTGRPGQDPEAALAETLRAIGPPVFWVLLAIAGGFAALLVCELKPVLDFAWLMLLAVLLLGAAMVLFLPFGILGRRPAPARDLPGQDRLGRLLDFSLAWVRRAPRTVAGGLFVPAVVLGVGLLYLRPQTDFTGNFRQDTPLYQAYNYIETRYGGAGQLDLVFDAPDLEKLSPDDLNAYLGKLRTLTERLPQGNAVTGAGGQRVQGVTKVLGLVNFLDVFNAAPTTALLPARARLRLLQAAKPNPVPSLYNRQAGRMRLILQVRERIGTLEKGKMLDGIRRTAAEVLGETAHPDVTGAYVMLAHLIENLLEDQKWTTLVALACQLIVGLLAFRNWWLAVLTMVPMVLPVAAVMGAMGWVGLPLNIATAMLASVAMGMAHSSSFLYLYRFDRERKAGAPFAAALETTHHGTGLALVVANTALVLGFGVLVLSRFIPLVHFGLLTGLALFGGLLGNLLLLPLLLPLVPGITGPAASAGPGPASEALAPAAPPPPEAMAEAPSAGATAVPRPAEVEPPRG